MKKIFSKKYLLTLIGLFILINSFVQAQPTPGDTGQGAENGGVVGGGADLSINIWFIPLLAVVYFIFKRRERIYQWYLNLDWGDYS